MQAYSEADLEALLLAPTLSLSTLARISRQPGGFLTHRLRARLWPKLLHINRYALGDFRVYLDPHRDDAQVKCDVDRCLWGFRHTSLWAEHHRASRRRALTSLISAMLCKHPTLFYYQGFHDVASIFLLVLEEDHLAFACIERTAALFFRDCMHADFSTFAKLAPLPLLLVGRADPRLHAHLAKVRASCAHGLDGCMTEWMDGWNLYLVCCCAVVLFC